MFLRVRRKKALVSKETPTLQDAISVLQADICIKILKLILEADTRATKAVSDTEKVILRTDSETIMHTLRISPKQYYGRMSNLLDNGLVSREKKGSSHRLTAYGRAVLKALTLVETATVHLSKLRVLDSLDLGQISEQDYEELVEVLIKDNNLKSYLLSKHFDPEKSKKEARTVSLNPKAT
jgi:DNA-binding PadR family transcriptional regulator